MAHWKKYMNTDFLGAYSIDDEDLILTIKTVGQEEFTGPRGKEKGLIVRWAEDEKPLICNATNAKRISALVGSPRVENWVGATIALYADDKVQAIGGGITEGVRVRQYLPKVETYSCSGCGAAIEDYGKYTARQMAERARTKYKKILCVDCAKATDSKQLKEDKKGDVLNNEDN